MKKITRKSFLQSVGGAAALGAMAGCSDTSSTTTSTSTSTSSTASSSSTTEEESTGMATAKGEFPIAKENITLTMMVMADNDAFLQENVEFHYALNRLQEELGVTFDIQFLPNSTDGKAKVITAFASNTYPDIISLTPKGAFSHADIIQYGSKEGFLLPLNDYIDQYADNLAEIFEQRSTYKASFTAPDGNIYGIPTINEIGHARAYPKMYLNHQWLENLGLPVPTTTDEFADVLRAFKTQDANGTGTASDQIPLTGTISSSGAPEYWLMNSFISCSAASTDALPRTFLSVIDGKIDCVADNDEWRDGLEWMAGLYEEGLIDPAAFVQDQTALTQVVSQLDGKNCVGALTADHFGMAGIYPGTDNIFTEYDVLMPLKGPKGVQYQPYTSYDGQLAGFNFLVTDKCQHPDVAFRIADHFMELIPNAFKMGTEGITYEVNTDPDVKNFLGDTLSCIPLSIASDATQDEKEEYYLGNGNFMRPWGATYEMRADAVAEWTEENYKSIKEVWNEATTVKLEPYFDLTSLPRDIFLMSEEDTTRFGELQTSIVQHILSNTAKFITGARSLTEWDTYVSELAAYGVEEYTTLYATSYNNTYGTNY